MMNPRPVWPTVRLVQPTRGFRAETCEEDQLTREVREQPETISIATAHPKEEGGAFSVRRSILGDVL